MNEAEIHEVTLKTDSMFDKLDQDHNGLISQTELSQFIAKNPTDVDSVTAAKFMLDNFQLVSNLEQYKSMNGYQIDGKGIGLSDLDTLKLLTEADGDGVNRLVHENDLSKALYGSLGGAAAAAGVFVIGMATEALPEVLWAAGPGALVAGVFAVGAAAGAGITYEVLKHEETTKYTQEQTQVAALYTK